jgi:predicted porin
MAEVTVYGKISLSAQQNSTETPKVSSGKVVVDESSTTTLEDNVSRLGFKGSEKLLYLGIEAIYVAEFAVWADDGSDTAGSSNAFRQRNIYVGAKGAFGTAIAGNFDTPLKSIQGKVDLFNDWRGDINTFITVNDYRRKNSVMYTSPKMAGFTGYVDVIMSEVNSEAADAVGEKGKDNAASLALAYEMGGLYVAAAYDQDVAVVETASLSDESQVYRLVAQYTMGPWQFGALYDNHDATTNTIATANNVSVRVPVENQGAGWIVSSQYTIDKWVLKAQYGQSDILRGTELDRDADVLSLGVDYKYSKNGRFYGFYTMESADLTLQPTVVGSQDNDFLGLGMELNF